MPCHKARALAHAAVVFVAVCACVCAILFLINFISMTKLDGVNYTYIRMYVTATTLAKQRCQRRHNSDFDFNQFSYNRAFFLLLSLSLWQCPLSDSHTHTRKPHHRSRALLSRSLDNRFAIFICNTDSNNIKCKSNFSCSLLHAANTIIFFVFCCFISFLFFFEISNNNKLTLKKVRC